MNRAKELPLWGMYALLAYMPFHIFLSQSLSLITGGLSVWKVAKDVFTVILVAICLVAIWQKRAYKNRLFQTILGATTVYLLLHVILYLIIRQTSLSVAVLAAVYNVRLFAYLLIGVTGGILFSKKLRLDHVARFILVISTIVCMVGLVQYFLPQDLLTHFGYSDARGTKPSFLIDNKTDLPRVFSTLREPNSLGALLVIPMLFLTTKFFANKRKILFGGLLLLHGLVLLLTFSRSAWVAAIVAELTFLFAVYRKPAIAFCKRHAVWLIALVLILAGGAYTLRDQYFVQNTLFHADENTLDEGSTNKHVDSIEAGVGSIVDKPLGHGPGTAGPVSYHTDKPVINENYYIQLGYELGIVGLLLFLATCIWLFIRLQMIGTIEAKVLYASLVGYAICNLFLHTWTNEAVAAQWWILTGLILTIQDRRLNSAIVNDNRYQKRSKTHV
jgi:O-antigen ligase